MTGEKIASAPVPKSSYEAPAPKYVSSYDTPKAPAPVSTSYSYSVPAPPTQVRIRAQSTLQKVAQADIPVAM